MVCRDVLRRVAVLAFAGIAVAPLPAIAQPVPPVRLSVATDGTQANGASTLLEISPDGRHVLFSSAASNLVPGDTNGVIDLFVRDRDTDADGVLDEAGAVRTLRVSVGPAGDAVENVVGGRLSRDGRFVLFSTTSALTAGDTNGQLDGFLYDRDADADGIFDEAGASVLSLATTGSGDALAVGGPSIAFQVTPDGRYVLFSSRATNLQPRPTTATQIYRKDRVTGVTTLVSSTPDGTPADADAPAISAVMRDDGRIVALGGGFQALWPLTAGVVTHPWVIRDLETNTFTPVAAPPRQPTAPNVFPGAEVAGFSPDGQRVYLGNLTVVASFVASSRSGSTLEYDIASQRVLQTLPGFVTGRMFDDGRSFPIIGAYSISFGFSADLSRYDAVTGRVTSLVPGSSYGAATANRRTLYRPFTGATFDLLDERYGVPLPMPAPVQTGILDGSGTTVFFTSADATIAPGGADTNGADDVFAVDLLSRLDRDADTLDDRWEAAMGLDYTSAAGTDGPAGDPDGDGQTNAQEEDAESHPRGTTRQFLAEGADNAFFKTRIGLANPGSTAATAVVRFDGDNGTSEPVNVHVPAGSKRTVFVDEVGPPTASFATVVESSAPLVTERTMSWDVTEYGAHAERASPAPATSWFLAEGATGAFSLFYLLQNPGDTAATATVRYLRPSPLPPVERTYVLAPHSRTTLPVNVQAPELASTDVSASITATAPILVERAMYRSVDGQPFAAGHASAGVTAASTSWFLAEGATGDFFDLFILLANPNPTDAQVEIRYFINGQVITMLYTVAAESRRTIYVDAENVGEIGQALAHGSVSSAITVTNGVPIVVERSMWFPGPAVSPVFWTEAHNSPGATGTATRWVLADGESGGARDAQTFVLIANTSPTPGRVRVTALPDTLAPPGSRPPAPSIVVDVAANSRTTIPMNTLPAVAGTRFGVLVESVETTPLAELVVERAMYWNAGGATWAAGTNLLATPVP